jgi:poly(A) polymerase
VKRERTLKKTEADLLAGTAGALRDLSARVAPAAKGLGLDVFLVGGAVRDILEGRTFSGEWDLVVFGDGPAGAASLADELARSWGCREPIAFPRFGTHLVLGRDFQVEVADSRLRSRLEKHSGDPLLDDALSRDFTLNALYLDLCRPWSPDGAGILDPCGSGLADLGVKLLRTPVPAAVTLGDDPLRVFRAARFRATRGYRISPAFARAASHTRNLLSRLAPERILAEVNGILLGPKPSAGIEPLARWGALESVLPEIHAMAGFRQESPYHFPDLLRHSLRVVDRCRDDLALRWAALLHDCGKPASRVVSEGGDSYHGHERVGAGLAAKALTRLKAGKKLTREVSELVELHMVHYTDHWSDRAVRRFVRRAGGHLEKLLDLVEADSAALKLRKEKLAELAKLRQRLALLAGKTLPPRSPLAGDRIMELLGLPPGPLVGAAKQALSEAVEDGEIEPAEEPAREFLINWWKAAGNRPS